MAGHPEFEDVSFEIGSEPMAIPYFTGYSMGLTQGASAMITLSERPALQKRVAGALCRTGRGHGRHSGDSPPPVQGNGLGREASSAAPIQLLVYGPDLELVPGLGEEVARIARETPGMVQVATTWASDRPLVDDLLQWLGKSRESP